VLRSHTFSFPRAPNNKPKPRLSMEQPEENAFPPPAISRLPRASTASSAPFGTYAASLVLSVETGDGCKLVSGDRLVELATVLRTRRRRFRMPVGLRSAVHRPSGHLRVGIESPTAVPAQPRSRRHAPHQPRSAQPHAAQAGRARCAARRPSAWRTNLSRGSSNANRRARTPAGRAIWAFGAERARVVGE
jgi:hypothetical protein